MKTIKINCVVFMYSCVRNGGTFPQFLIDSIGQFLGKENTHLVILNDVFGVTSENITEALNLAGRNNITICEVRENKEKVGCHRELSFESLLYNSFNSKQISPQSTITIGCIGMHLNLKRHSLLHFHVGNHNCLDRQMRGLIPLTGQYEAGVSNILKYFTNNDLVDEAIDYSDLIRFVANSKAFFRGDDAGRLLLQKHVGASFDLAKRFPEQIVAIFGVGFPFYLIESDLTLSTVSTPESILRYFDIQYEYFQRKVLNEELFKEHSNELFSVEEMADKFSIEVKRNEFDQYKYQMMGHPVPVFASIESDLQGYFENACFSIISDIWPCYYCSTLQLGNKYPHQIEVKYTNTTCLPCKQTSLMLRNVMSCTPDIDMVVVVSGDKETLAENIEEYILHESPYYMYDTDFHRTILGNEGPVDLFVTDVAEIANVLQRVIHNKWFDVTFNSIALWSPRTPYLAQFGLSFPLAFEPVFVKDEMLSRKFVQARRIFAWRYSIQDVLKELSHVSFYTKQLVSNSSVVSILEDRLLRWRQLPEG